MAVPVYAKKVIDFAMNKTISNFTRDKIKSGLNKLPSGYQLMFKRMYSANDLNMDIYKVVDNMPDEKLDWALTQVETTLIKLDIKI